MTWKYFLHYWPFVRGIHHAVKWHEHDDMVTWKYSLHYWPFVRGIHHAVKWHEHDDMVTWKYFLHYWPCVRGIHQSLVDSPHKGPVMHTFDIFIVSQFTNKYMHHAGEKLKQFTVTIYMFECTGYFIISTPIFHEKLHVWMYPLL